MPDPLPRRDAQVFYAKHMHAGIARYDNEDLLVDTPAAKTMNPTFAGKPIYVHHRKGGLPVQDNEEAGWVSRSFYNELDGWHWAEILVLSDEGKQKIKDGWAVSNAFIPGNVAGRGTKHNVPYNREVLNAEYTHLALTPVPRYEQSCVLTPDEFKSYQARLKTELDELKNDKQTAPNEEKRMFKIFKNKQEETASIDKDTMIDLGNGSQVSFGEMLNAVEKDEKEKAAAAEKEKADKEAAEKTNSSGLDQEITVGTEKMKVSVLAQRYLDLREKRNSEDEEKKAKEAKEADDAEKKKKAEDEKENARKAEEQKNFDEVANANRTKAEPPQKYDMNQTARGLAMFGTPKS